jgi:hypothetical protein
LNRSPPEFPKNENPLKYSPVDQIHLNEPKEPILTPRESIFERKLSESEKRLFEKEEYLQIIRNKAKTARGAIVDLFQVSDICIIIERWN